MKLALNGQIIDTEHIWKIDEIKCSGGSNYYFETHFFNQKTITIALHYSFEIDGRTDECPSPEIKVKNRLSQFRNKLIGYWSNNQSEIIQLECGYSSLGEKQIYYENDYD